MQSCSGAAEAAAESSERACEPSAQAGPGCGAGLADVGAVTATGDPDVADGNAGSLVG